MRTGKPERKESADYYWRYIDTVVNENFVNELKANLDSTSELLSSIGEDQWSHKYAPGKWSIAEVLTHVIDAERVFSYRALRIGRGDQTALPGFDQDDYVPQTDSDQRSPSSIIDEYRTVRASTISLFENMPSRGLSYRGTASDMPITPYALGFIIAGHENWHVEILKERYLT